MIEEQEGAMPRPARATEPVPTVLLDIRVDDKTDLVSIRRDIERALTAHVGDADARSSIVIAASELIANGVQHGRPPVTLHLAISEPGTTLAVTVTDHGGRPIPAPPHRPPDPATQGGRGLWLVTQLADSLTRSHHHDEVSARANFCIEARR